MNEKTKKQEDQNEARPSEARERILAVIRSLQAREKRFRFWDLEENDWMVDGRTENNIYDFAFKHGMCWGFIPYKKAFDRVVVTQYTGKRDKNDRKIWEGDICKFHYFYFNGSTEAENEIISVIKYTEYGIEIMYEGEWMPVSLFNGYHEESFEKIGDVFKNPELLE